MYVFCTFLNNLENANHHPFFLFYFAYVFPCVRMQPSIIYLKNAYCMVVLFNLNHNISYRIYNNFSI